MKYLNKKKIKFTTQNNVLLLETRVCLRPPSAAFMSSSKHKQFQVRLKAVKYDTVSLEYFHVSIFIYY